MSGVSARRAVAYIRVADPSAAGRSDVDGSESSASESTPPSGSRRKARTLTGAANPPGSVKAQQAAIESWAEREGIAITSWQIDTDVDGATPIAERPGLLAAYNALRIYRAGILVAANAERFSKDELVAWLIERAALTEGAAIHTADGSRSARPDERGEVHEQAQEDAGFTRGAIDLARAYDRVMFRARIRNVLAEKKARGERIGNVPFGYRLAADGLHLEPNEGEQAILATVRALSASGLSQRGIVAELAARGVTGRTGAPLGQTQVAKLLRAS